MEEQVFAGLGLSSDLTLGTKRGGKNRELWRPNRKGDNSR
jgi:hypothetical protein